MWGDTGRIPIVFDIAKLATDYFKRLELLNDDAIVKKAFIDQMNLKLSWYVANQSLIQTFGSGTRSQTSLNVYTNIKNKFIDRWCITKNNLPKMEFYNNVKTVFQQEKFLEISKPADKRSLFKLRASSHRLNVEVGRYDKNPIPRTERVCKYCVDNLNLKFVDDEKHVIESCPFYNDERHDFVEKLSKIIGPFNTAGLLAEGLGKVFMSTADIRICRAQATYTCKILNKHKELEDKPPPKTKNGTTRTVQFLGPIL